MTPQVPKEPLQKIALSCSGGGYRAASFHLGAMAYLNSVIYQGKPLLENVKLISTVSGGTITGAVYALQKQQGKSFDAFYTFLMHKLLSLDLIKISIAKLNIERGIKNPYKTNNLINAFAELYDDHFTSGATFSVFNDLRSHLDAVVFNSTEFSNGINFRFRNRGTGFFGNHIIRVEQTTAEEVKLADAMAASTCFPGGFEPILWPRDFVHADAPNLKELSAKTENVGLMDGGIYDNQGIQSVLLYKKSAELYFDLIIISDVASPDMARYQATAEKPLSGFRKLTLNAVQEQVKTFNKRVNVILVIMALLFFTLPILWNYEINFNTGLMIGLACSSIVLFIAKQIILSKLFAVVEYVKSLLIQMIPSFYREKLSALKIESLSVGRAEPLILDRVHSLVTLLMNVFLKVIRRLNYGDLYNDKSYRYRRATNLIKELTEENYNNSSASERADLKGTSASIQTSQLQGDYKTVVGDKIKAVAEEASSFGTTLWFTEDDQLANMLNKLVATGEFTMCYNLLDYLEQLLFTKNNGFDKLPATTQNDLTMLYKHCSKDWERFKENPMFMVERKEANNPFNKFFNLTT